MDDNPDERELIAFHDMLCETGQELDSCTNLGSHYMGQLILFVAQVANGSTPNQAAKSLTEYEGKWERGESPYTLRKIQIENKGE